MKINFKENALLWKIELDHAALDPSLFVKQYLTMVSPMLLVLSILTIAYPCRLYTCNVPHLHNPYI